MCVDLDYAKSGNKAEKISRIFRAFEQELDIVSFLSRLKNETLKDILEDFKDKFPLFAVMFVGNKDELLSVALSACRAWCREMRCNPRIGSSRCVRTRGSHKGPSGQRERESSVSARENTVLPSVQLNIMNLFSGP